MTLWGTFQLDKFSHLRNTLKSKTSQLWEQNVISTLIGMQKCPDSKIISLKNSLEKANET